MKKSQEHFREFIATTVIQGGQKITVAAHSIFVAELAFLEARKLQFTVEDAWSIYKIALLHDAAEAFIGDIPTPLKILIGMNTPVLVDLEKNIQKAIHEQLLDDHERNMAKNDFDIIKRADRVAYVTEAVEFFPKRDNSWLVQEPTNPVPLDLSIITTRRL